MRFSSLQSIPTLLVLLSPIVTFGYDQSLDDCKAVAAIFQQTCDHGDYDTPASYVADIPAETYNCENKGQCIPAGTRNGNDCSWPRRLCVTCRVNSDDVTMIRLQTNNLPNHCVQSVQLKEMNFDYEAPFNSKEVNGAGEWLLELTTQSEVDAKVCPIRKHYDAEALGITEFGEEQESSNAMGIALNGVAFQFANQILEDPVYPISVSNEQPLDLCMGHNQQNSDTGMYHYHDVSPCINPDFLQGRAVLACKDEPDCAADITAWALSGFEKEKTVIGVAKDGHVLYGPYDDTGEPWQSSNVDPCNGVWSDDKEDYFYVATQWHPYVVGCFGPANFPQNFEEPIYAECSLNGMDKYVDEATEATTSAPTSAPTSASSGDSDGPAGEVEVGGEGSPAAKTMPNIAASLGLGVFFSLFAMMRMHE